MKVGATRTDAAGAYRYRVKPGASRTLYVVYPGSASLRPAASQLLEHSVGYLILDASRIRAGGKLTIDYRQLAASLSLHAAPLPGYAWPYLRGLGHRPSPTARLALPRSGELPHHQARHLIGLGFSCLPFPLEGQTTKRLPQVAGIRRPQGGQRDGSRASYKGDMKRTTGESS